MLIYKILGGDEWQAARAAGQYQGSAVDRADGYVHFSTGEQVVETAARHFADQDNLILVTVDADRLGEALRWESSRGGAPFPHLYAPLPVSAVVAEVELPGGVPVDRAIADAMREA